LKKTTEFEGREPKKKSKERRKGPVNTLPVLFNRKRKRKGHYLPYWKGQEKGGNSRKKEKGGSGKLSRRR